MSEQISILLYTVISIKIQSKTIGQEAGSCRNFDHNVQQKVFNSHSSPNYNFYNFHSKALRQKQNKKTRNTVGIPRKNISKKISAVCTCCKERNSHKISETTKAKSFTAKFVLFCFFLGGGGVHVSWEEGGECHTLKSLVKAWTPCRGNTFAAFFKAEQKGDTWQP